MNIVITGGAGFVGANLTRALLDVGHGVTIFDNLSAGRIEYLPSRGERFIAGDCRDTDALMQALPGHDAIVHLAGVPGVNASVWDTAEHNIYATLCVLEAAKALNIRRVIFASSGAVELAQSFYGASKRACEAYLNAYLELDAVALRFTNVYGPYSDHKESVVHRFIRASLAGQPLTVHGDGKQGRDFVYVGDVCDVIIREIETRYCGVYGVGSQKTKTVLQLAQMIGGKIIYEDKPCGERLTPPAIDLPPQWRAETSLWKGLEYTKNYYLEVMNNG